MFFVRKSLTFLIGSTESSFSRSFFAFSQVTCTVALAPFRIISFFYSLVFPLKLPSLSRTSFSALLINDNGRMDCSSGEVPFYFFVAPVLNIYRHQIQRKAMKQADAWTKKAA